MPSRECLDSDYLRQHAEAIARYNQSAQLLGRDPFPKNTETLSIVTCQNLVAVIAEIELGLARECVVMGLGERIHALPTTT